MASNSTGNPGESANPGMLAVGAANWATPATIESFSSRGPTTDGRTKPDIVGADRADSATFGDDGFAGTSQASPHVAGLAALVRQQFPALTPSGVASYLKDNALPRDAVPNNTWGFGLAQLPSLTPGPPTDVTAVAGPGEATVSWSAPAADRGSAITHYTVTSDPDDLTSVVGGSAASTTVTQLAFGTTYTFTVTATNAVGTSTPSAVSNSVTPTNSPPVVVAADDLALNEGEAQDRQLATFTDIDTAQAHTATIDWGDGTVTPGTVVESGGSGEVSGAHSYADDDGFTVTISVADSEGATSTDNLTITVNNVAPTVTAGTLEQLSEGLIILPPATFSDPGVADTRTGVINWGDGATSTAAVNATSHEVTGQHAYTVVGTYNITITVEDDDGGSGSAALTVEIVSVPTVVAIPGLTSWGMMALAGLFAIALGVKRLTRPPPHAEGI